MAAGVEIPFWIFGQQKWVSGINRNTTCAEVKLVQMISSRFNKIYFNLSSVVRILILYLHLQILTVTQQQHNLNPVENDKPKQLVWLVLGYIVSCVVIIVDLQPRVSKYVRNYHHHHTVLKSRVNSTLSQS